MQFLFRKLLEPLKRSEPPAPHSGRDCDCTSSSGPAAPALFRAFEPPSFPLARILEAGQAVVRQQVPALHHRAADVDHPVPLGLLHVHVLQDARRRPDAVALRVVDDRETAAAGAAEVPLTMPRGALQSQAPHAQQTLPRIL